MEWKKKIRADDGRTSDAARYATDDGEWTITKEFYADGPSLFTWVLRRNGLWQSEHLTLKAAKKAAVSSTTL